MTSPAPAMPTEEEIAKAMRTARLKATSAAPMLIGYSGLAPAEDADLASARAVLALFAEVLAEKEREIRERCAKVAEGDSALFDHQHALAEGRDIEYGHQMGRAAAAAAIRAQGE